MPSVAIFINGFSLNVLHHKVRQALFSRAAIKESSDIGMIQAGQDLPFLPKASEDGVGDHAAFDNLDSDLFPVLIVSASGEINLAHAPCPQARQDLVVADPPPPRIL